ncbi:MAG TPA: aminoacyl-tRNA hydrolase [Anaerohalosphaeraceae bacterium]|nr:aminoacyl-tRNA hydrolase [Phycisphaerae bacterium]HOK95369.1 aminoacyl-tRNA hydrolase [Anaerohalosphaeraceae bacterium]HOL31005.1 aminoacyl-tRNA hydrolase [Anaerohalosphaeraceae bacterium]HOM76107.1 aminoacyl-tRNA hydrolase [Anaerohalosphaeraceae bacterium]HPC63350.1 aminoacyl-tRNA hydrolase [Anaerohalosphaeraceae bacterium]
MTKDWNEVFGCLTGIGSLETKEAPAVKLIAGLGNPGAAYAGTRHNVGFMVLDAIAQQLGAAFSRSRFNALFEEVSAQGYRLLLLKPQQFMNRSGHSVASAAGFYKLQPDKILVVTDDMALPVGRIRLRAKGSAGGHNGLKDVIARLGTDQFARLRVGIGPSGTMDSADYVLSKFAAEEQSIIAQAVHTAAGAALCWAAEGIDAAMNRYNVQTEAGSPQKNDASGQPPSAM